MPIAQVIKRMALGRTTVHQPEPRQNHYPWADAAALARLAALALSGGLGMSQPMTCRHGLNWQRRACHRSDRPSKARPTHRVASIA
jgi:hypothetical protein